MIMEYVLLIVIRENEIESNSMRKICSGGFAAAAASVGLFLFSYVLRP